MLLAIQSDFYIRLFVEVNFGRKGCANTICQHGMNNYCIGCGAQWATPFASFETIESIKK